MWVCAWRGLAVAAAAQADLAADATTPLRTVAVVVLAAAGAATWFWLARSTLPVRRRLIAEVAAAACWVAGALVLCVDAMARYAALQGLRGDAWMRAYIAAPLRLAAFGFTFGCLAAVRVAASRGVRRWHAERSVKVLAVVVLLLVFAGGCCTGMFWLGDLLRTMR